MGRTRTGTVRDELIPQPSKQPQKQSIPYTGCLGECSHVIHIHINPLWVYIIACTKGKKTKNSSGNRVRKQICWGERRGMRKSENGKKQTTPMRHNSTFPLQKKLQVPIRIKNILLFIYTFNAIPIKMPTQLFTDLGKKTILNVIWKNKNPKQAETILYNKRTFVFQVILLIYSSIKLYSIGIKSDRLINEMKSKTHM